MKLTLLNMVQNILSAMDSDEVNSIGDTIESVQVAEVVKETYYDLFSNIDIPTFHGLIQLTAATDLTSPTKMILPTNVKEVEWIKYNWQVNSTQDFRDVSYVTPKEFVELGISRATQTGTVTALVGTIPVNISTLYPPTYWTTFDNNTIYFDSYKLTLEATVQTSNVLCYGQYEESWTQADTFIPSLDSNLFPLLLSEAKSVCFLNFKQIANPKEENRSRRLQVTSQNDRWRANQRDYLANEPNYGRISPTPRRVPTIKAGS